MVLCVYRAVGAIDVVQVYRAVVLLYAVPSAPQTFKHLPMLLGIDLLQADYS